jgi:hypothetical protein
MDDLRGRQREREDQPRGRLDSADRSPSSDTVVIDRGSAAFRLGEDKSTRVVALATTGNPRSEQLARMQLLIKELRERSVTSASRQVACQTGERNHGKQEQPERRPIKPGTDECSAHDGECRDHHPVPRPPSAQVPASQVKEIRECGGAVHGDQGP